MNQGTNGVHVNGAAKQLNGSDESWKWNEVHRQARIKQILAVGSRTVTEIASELGLSHLPHVVRASLREMKEAGDLDVWAHGRQAQRWGLASEPQSAIESPAAGARFQVTDVDTADGRSEIRVQAVQPATSPESDQFAQLRSFAFGIAEEAESIINHASRLGDDAEAMAFVRIAVEIRRLVGNIEAVCP